MRASQGTDGTVGPEGAVAIVYHGTVRRFSVFDPARSETEHGCFFSDTPEGALLYADREGGRIVEVEIRLANPYRCTAREWNAGTCPDPASLARDGVHDGMAIEGLDGVAYVAWLPETMRIVADAFRYGTEAFDRIRERAIQLGYVEAESYPSPSP